MSRKLNDRIRFERRAEDENGDRLGAWEEVYTGAAEITWLRGSEPVQAQRLQGIQPAVIAVRACAAARALVNDCRAVDARLTDPQAGDYFAVRGATLTPDRMFVEVLAERGADG